MSIQAVKKPYLWLAAAVIIRIALFLYQTTLPDTDGMDMLGRYGCDTPAYFNPVENLIEEGSYQPDFRMPGYGGLYFVLRLFLSIPDTYDVLVFFQVLMSGIAVYFLAQTAFYISESKRVFKLVFVFSLLTFYNAVYDAYLLTESFCTSAGIFAFYFLVKALKQKASFSFLLSGLFFCWMIFVKPVYLGLFIIVLAFLLILKIRKSTRSLSAGVLGFFLLVMPFVVADTVWAVRNYNIHGSIPLLTNPFFAPPDTYAYQKPMTKFLQSWGGTHSVWLPHGHNLWFEGNREEEGLIRFPSHLLEGSINKDSLFVLREYVSAIRDTTLTPEENLYYDTLAAQTLERFTNYIKDEQPVRYYAGVPLAYLNMFYMVPGTYLLFNQPFYELHIVQKIFLLLIASLHYLVLLGGTLSAFILLFARWKSHALYILPAITCIFTFFIFPLILRMPDARFIVPAFPFMLVSVVLMLRLIKFI